MASFNGWLNRAGCRSISYCYHLWLAMAGFPELFWVHPQTKLAIPPPNKEPANQGVGRLQLKIGDVQGLSELGDRK